MYDITISSNEGGTVSPQSGSFEEGSSVTFTATPIAEYEFSKWSNGSIQNPLILTVTSNLTLQAIFTKKQYELIISKEGEGTVNEKIINTGKGYDSGTKVELTAVPAGEWVFAGWSGDVTSNDNPLQVTISSPKNIIAKFVKRKYPLTINIEGQGTVTEEIVNTGRTTDYESGITVKLKALPDLQNNWEFVGWTGSIESRDNTIEVNISQSMTLTAKFIRYFDYSKPSINYKNSELWVDFFKIGNRNDGYHSGSAFADFNSDGYVDLFLSYKNNTGTRFPVEIYINKGDNENFEKFNSINNNIGADTARKSIVGDFNLDGKPDVFIADHGSEIPGESYDFAFPSIMLSNSNGEYDFKVLDNLSKAFYHGATSGDFIKDGDLDIFCSTKLMLINNGDGTFTEDYSSFSDSSNGIFTVEFFDFNKDGYLDLLCGGHSMSESWGEIPSSRIYYGNGQNFSTERSLLLPNLSGWEVTVDYEIADINNDGIEEIFLVRTGGFVDENNQMANFYNGWRIQILELLNNQYVDNTSKYMDVFYGDSQWMVRLRVQDIDNDGKLEMFENEKTNYLSYKPRFWRQNSNLIFEKVDIDFSSN